MCPGGTRCAQLARQSGAFRYTYGMPVDNLQGKKILWVEDDQFLGDLISRKLAKESGEFLYAQDGTKALEVISHKTPDIIVLDLMLPGMSGFDLLEKVRQIPATKNTPVIVLSNMSQNSDFERGRKLGVKGFFVKAMVTIDEVLIEIKKLL